MSVWITDDDIFFADKYRSTNLGLYRWKENYTDIESVLADDFRCWQIFIDIYGSIYCSLYWDNKVVKRPFDANIDTIVEIANLGNPIDAIGHVNAPRGIFVRENLDIYIAECGNDRIQLFPSNSSQAQIIVGIGGIWNISFNCPTDIVFDGTGYLYVVTTWKNSVHRFGPTGYGCVVGCSYVKGNAPDQLANPRGMAFDSDGNIYLTDLMNNRVQKFLLIVESCSKSFSHEYETGQSL